MSTDRHRETIKNLAKKIFKERSRALIKSDKVTVGWPAFDEKEVLSVIDTLFDMRISQGPAARKFEEDFAKYMGMKYAVAVNSGSSANLIALASLIESGNVAKGSEVIVPAATFSAVVSPILQLGLHPVYVDVDENSWNIDPREVERAISKKTRVIMPVHSFGNPAEMADIMKIAKEHNLIVLEDCCEAHGASISKKKVGSFGDLSTLSFFVAHNITTGEGGMVFTNNSEYYDLLTSLREFGRLPLDIVHNQRFKYRDKILGKYDTRYIFNRLGYNVRMTDIAASLGIEQLKKLDLLNRRRLGIVKKYQAALARYKKYLRLPEIRRGTFHSFYGYPLVIEKKSPFTRHDLVLFLEKRGIETRPFFAGCLPDQPAFRDQPKRIVGNLAVSRWIRDNSFFIGCHSALSERQVNIVINAFDDFFSSHITNNS